jgi:hypothetical protein
VWNPVTNANGYSDFDSRNADAHAELHTKRVQDL